MARAWIIDGKALADELSRRVAAAATRFSAAAGAAPGLTAILVGDDPASRTYVGRKDRAAAAAGLASQTLALPAATSQTALLAEVERLNRDDRVDGILVQLPLPPQIDARRVLAAVDPAKDVDGFHPLNVGRLWSGLPALVPATPQGCMILLKSVHADLAGLEAAVLGRSNIVGKPMAALLLAADCTVGWVHSRSRDAAAVCRRADLLVAAAGRPELVGRDWIKPGATVIDVGINRILSADGKSRLVGDVDYAAASGVAGAITPVPGGVGPMTIACLLRNTLLAASRRRGLADPAL
ncbi:MAG TPA: bifunctional methylenetetrahydrofolate dehydrogenase/methenyltetrahydrofolate cyclohydrolase FolD [Stellaceae bacterium]|nr:bifunctional methylenetetrahydrofolate dehydrogenase/methenyltetrahydrofolate cyclohydrolase FolD [Stellaceae bacterium]